MNQKPTEKSRWAFLFGKMGASRKNQHVIAPTISYPGQFLQFVHPI